MISQDSRQDAKSQPHNSDYQEISPGAYTEDAEGAHLVRNRDLRFSLVGAPSTRDLEMGLSEDVATPQDVSASGAFQLPDDDTSEQTFHEEFPSYSLTGLAKAVPVSDSSMVLADEIEEVDPVELKAQEEIRVRSAVWRAIVLTICGLVTLTIILLVACFGVMVDDEDNVVIAEPLEPPTAAPTPFYFDVPVYTAASIESSATAQAQAYRWLLADPRLQDYPEWRLHQRFALATLYFATTSRDIVSDRTKGHNWKHEKSWLLYDAHECDWYGDESIELGFTTVRVTSPCGEDKSFERLWLQNNNLNGSLPPEISMITSLKSVALSGNHLQGTLPTEIWQLPDLKHMLLSYNNNITGSIPTEIGLATKLESLSMQWTRASGTVPTEAGSLSDLQILALTSSQFDGPIPSELGLLPKLEFAILGGNQFDGKIPSELGIAPSLRFLLVDYNELTGAIPTGLGMASKLFYLAASDNHLSGTLPTELFHLTALQEISLNRNRLTGEIPSEIGLMKKNSFFATENLLTGTFPTELAQLSELDDLSINNNLLTGEIPSEIGLITSLKNLQINDNHFNGTLPREIGELRELRVLVTSANDITGALPTEIGFLSNLVYFNASSNLMTGRLPSEIGALTAVDTLDLQHNVFVAPLPAEMSNLGNLTRFQWGW